MPIKDYLRAARIRKAFYHATTRSPLRLDGGLHAGTVRAALDRAAIHCQSESSVAAPTGRDHYTGHDHYIVRVKPKFTTAVGSYEHPADDEGGFWPSNRGSTIYRNDYEHRGSRSVLISPKDSSVTLSNTVRIPHHIVRAHNQSRGAGVHCPPRCIHERLVENMVKREGI